MSTFVSKLSIPRMSRIIRPFRYMYSTYNITNSTNTTKKSQETKSSFSAKKKGVCVTLTSLNSPFQVVKHSSLYTDKGYRYLCFKLADSTASNHELTSHILSVLDQPEELSELGLLLHIVLPQPKQYLQTLLNNWASSELFQSNKLPLKGIVIDTIQSNPNMHNQNVRAGVSTISIQPGDTGIANSQNNEVLLLNLSNNNLARDNDKSKENTPTKLSYKSVLHNFLDFIETP